MFSLVLHEKNCRGHHGNVDPFRYLSGYFFVRIFSWSGCPPTWRAWRHNTPDRGRDPKGAVSHRNWRADQGQPFCQHLEKSRQIRVRKGSLNLCLVLLNFVSSDPVLKSWKSKCQSLSRQQHAGSPQILSTKSNYFPHGRTNTLTSGFDVQHGWKKRFAQ